MLYDGLKHTTENGYCFIENCPFAVITKIAIFLCEIRSFHKGDAEHSIRLKRNVWQCSPVGGMIA